MTDEQAELLIVALNEIRDAICECTDKIVDSLDNIPATNTARIEKTLSLVVDAIDDAAQRI